MSTPLHIQAAIYAAAEAGATTEDLCERFDLPFYRIPQIVGIERRKRILKALDAGKDPEAIAEEFNVALSRVWQIFGSDQDRKARGVARPDEARKRPKPTAAEIKARALELATRGLKYRAIAEALKINPSQCYRMLDRERRRRLAAHEDII